MPLLCGCLQNFSFTPTCPTTPKQPHNSFSCIRSYGAVVFVNVRLDTWACITARLSEKRTVFHQADTFRLTCIWECVSTSHPHVRNTCESHNVKVINQRREPGVTYRPVCMAYIGLVRSCREEVTQIAAHSALKPQA